MKGMISYEEMVRVERANGLRKADLCGNTKLTAEILEEEKKALAGKTYADVTAMPQPSNTVCPYSKVVIPVNPTIIPREQPKYLDIATEGGKHRVVDFNRCDGRTNALNALHRDAEFDMAETETTYSTRVVDTPYDDPFKAKVVEEDIKNIGAGEQPAATNATEAEPVVTTADGKEATPEEDA